MLLLTVNQKDPATLAHKRLHNKVCIVFVFVLTAYEKGSNVLYIKLGRLICSCFLSLLGAACYPCLKVGG